jgi:ABC-type nickel/cobalt efflux system permease component RcnA
MAVIILCVLVWVCNRTMCSVRLGRVEELSPYSPSALSSSQVRSNQEVMMTQEVTTQHSHLERMQAHTHTHTHTHTDGYELSSMAWCYEMVAITTGLQGPADN